MFTIYMILKKRWISIFTKSSTFLRYRLSYDIDLKKKKTATKKNHFLYSCIHQAFRRYWSISILNYYSNSGLICCRKVKTKNKQKKPTKQKKNSWELHETSLRFIIQYLCPCKSALCFSVWLLLRIYTLAFLQNPCVL